MLTDILAVLVTFFFILLLVSAAVQSEDDKAREAAAKQPQTAVGVFQDAVHSEQSDVTTLILTNGTRIRVQGAYPVVKPGMPVTTPNGADPKGRLYCISNRCLFEAEK